MWSPPRPNYETNHKLMARAGRLCYWQLIYKSHCVTNNSRVTNSFVYDQRGSTNEETIVSREGGLHESSVIGTKPNLEEKHDEKTDFSWHGIQREDKSVPKDIICPNATAYVILTKSNAWRWQDCGQKLIFRIPIHRNSWFIHSRMSRSDRIVHRKEYFFVLYIKSNT